PSPGDHGSSQLLLLSPPLLLTLYQQQPRGHPTSPSVRVLLLLNGKSWKGLISPPMFIGFFFCLPLRFPRSSLAWSGRDSLATPPPARGPSTDPNPYRYHHHYR